MALNKERLSGRIKAILDEESLEENDAEQSRERFADKLADALIDEVKQAKIIYTTGLTSATGGIVSGTFNGNLE